MLLLLKNALIGGSSGECRTVARGNLGPEAVVVLLRTLCQATPVVVQKFLEMRCCLIKKIVPIYGPTSPLKREINESNQLTRDWLCYN